MKKYILGILIIILICFCFWFVYLKNGIDKKQNQVVLGSVKGVITDTFVGKIKFPVIGMVTKIFNIDATLEYNNQLSNNTIESMIFIDWYTKIIDLSGKRHFLYDADSILTPGTKIEVGKFNGRRDHIFKNGVSVDLLSGYASEIKIIE